MSEDKPNGIDKKKLTVLPSTEPLEVQVGISIRADKPKQVVMMEFDKPIKWLAFDTVSCASFIKLLGEKIKELHQ